MADKDQNSAVAFAANSNKSDNDDKHDPSAPLDDLLLRIKKLPLELRLKILIEGIHRSFVEELLDHRRHQIPSILSILKSGPDKEPCTEYIDEYTRIYAQVDARNIKEFKKRKMKDLLQIQCIAFIFPLTFKAQKITLMNKFETIILDCTYGCGVDDMPTIEEDELGPEIRPRNLLHWVIQANQNTMRRVVLKTRWTSEVNGKEICDFSNCFGFMPRKRQFEEGIVHWVWEKTGDSILTWSRDEYAKPWGGPVKLADLRAARLI